VQPLAPPPLSNGTLTFPSHYPLGQVPPTIEKLSTSLTRGEFVYVVDRTHTPPLRFAAEMVDWVVVEKVTDDAAVRKRVVTPGVGFAKPQGDAFVYGLRGGGGSLLTD
jgi:hypothetical protein